jgi:para-nitrobenzyl esterase
MDPLVKTRHGEARGRLEDGVAVFRGIPFAAPPFGAHRFRPPQPVEPWTGVRDATAFGAIPPALPPGPEVKAFVPDVAAPGEDCLNLNLWTPEPGAAGLPVMVWITGGFFKFGSGAPYDGSRFARDGVVCVTLNYRAGPEGFLDLGDGLANLGLLDQVAALEWVRDSVAAFGGDPGGVTVFGESAGAMSIGTLLSMPRAEGLFRRAIAQSGAAHTVSPGTVARRIGADLAARVGVPATRDAIAAVPLDRLWRAQAELEADLLADPDPRRWGREVVVGSLPWQPSVDGEVVPERPIDRIAAGAGGGIDVIVGTNVDEGRLGLVATGTIDRVPEGALAAAADLFGLDAGTAVAAYRSAYPGHGEGDLLAALQTDGFWRVPALRLADAHAGSRGTTHMYEFAWRSPAFGGLLGACHGLEVPFVFDTLEPGAMLGPALGDSPPQQLADAMHSAWVAFATRGDPGWPAYDLDRRATRRSDTTSEVVDDPRAAERRLWEGVL